MPAGLSDLVMKLLEKDPARRIGSAEEVAQASTKLRQNPAEAPAVPLATPVPSARTNPDTVLFETAKIAPVRPTVAPRKARPVILASFAVAAVVALSLCALVAGGVIVYRLIFPTASGELVVETEGNAKVAFEKGKLLIYDPDGKNLLYTLSVNDKSKNLPLGKYKIKVVDANDVELDADAFEMTKKGWKVRVRMLPNNRIAQKGPDQGASLKNFKNSLGMEFALVPKGKSWLGGGAGQEGPVEVNIGQDFYLGVYEVTQEEWRKIMGKNPSLFSRDRVGKEVGDDELKRFPVENVTWLEAKEFVKLVNEKVKNDPKEAGWEYRLPTEQQWEYACRGGAMTDRAESAFDFYFAKPTNTLSRDHANFDESGLKRPRKVGSYPPNRLGLHDMHGNVWEWCEDRFDPMGNLNRVCRGGSLNGESGYCRAANRHGGVPDLRSDESGLRLARIPVAAAVVKAPIAEPGILDFAEIHDADAPRFDAWIARMQKDSFRPVSLSIQVLKDAPRYTAVAIKEEKKRIWEFMRGIFGMEVPQYEEMWGKNYAATIQTPYTHGDKHRVAVVWVWNMLRHFPMWTGDKPFIDEKIAEAGAAKVVPIYRTPAMKAFASSTRSSSAPTTASPRTTSSTSRSTSAKG